NQVPVSRYLTLSEEALISQRLAAEECFKQEGLLNDFKERALMEMMDGVLEARSWEEKLKDEIHKPYCLVNKLPDMWTEGDQREVYEYNREMAHLKKERNKYKVRLMEEWEQTVTDLQMRAAGLEIAEAEATLQHHTRNVALIKDNISHLTNCIGRILCNQNKLEQDPVIQLNLLQGQVEVDLTGHFEDFRQVQLISKSKVNSINNKVINAGCQKIAESEKADRLRQLIQDQEWTQKELKITIENLDAHIKRIERTKISRETLEFLRDEERGCVAKDTWLAKTDQDAKAMVAVSVGYLYFTFLNRVV
ncbi:hypothetical protein WDU94_013741, partial [Cyamophila willieti]